MRSYNCHFFKTNVIRMAKHNPIKFGSIRLSNKCENEPSSLFKYADDGCIAVSYIDLVCDHRIMQLMCKYLHVWGSKWKPIPNCDKNKTECIMIAPTSSSATDVTAFRPLIVGNRPTTYTCQSTVLGLKIDKKLTFKGHTN